MAEWKSRWEVKLHLSALKAGRRLQPHLCELCSRVIGYKRAPLQLSMSGPRCWPDATQRRKQRWWEKPRRRQRRRFWASRCEWSFCVCVCVFFIHRDMKADAFMSSVQTLRPSSLLPFRLRHLHHTKQTRGDCKALQQQLGCAACAARAEHLIWIHSRRRPYTWHEWGGGVQDFSCPRRELHVQP